MSLTKTEHALMTEMNEAAAILAEALGYHHDPEYGWATGDHTIVTLAMEVRSNHAQDLAKLDALATWFERYAEEPGDGQLEVSYANGVDQGMRLAGSALRLFLAHESVGPPE